MRDCYIEYSKPTAMYDRVPTNELTNDALELRSRPLTPKSHSLISPRELTRILDGLISLEKTLKC